MGISLVLSSFRRAGLLEKSLFSIARQKVSSLEVIVVNDGIEDDTEAVVNQYRKSLDIHYIFSGRRNISGDKWRVSGFALNIGVKVAKYDKIILSCAEIYHLNDAISHIQEALEDRPRSLATPEFIYFDKDGSFVSSIENGEDPEKFVIDDESKDAKLMPFFMGMCKQRFMEIGGYDEDFIGYACDDNDLVFRLLSNGCHYSFTKAEVVHLYHGKRCDSQLHPENPDWAYNYNLFLNRQHQIVRNQNREWGKNT